MGKITKALQKAASERLVRLDKISRIQEHEQIVVRKMKDSKIDARLITYFDSKSVISEQYKTLTTNLLNFDKGRPPHTIGVTSSVHSEGKTVTALNLAITLSQASNNAKILLIDADMRKGQMINYLGTGFHIGLSEYLSGKAQLNDVVFHVDIENLSFISCGAVPPNPAELLGSSKFKELLSNMRSQYEFVIIDTPPVIPVTDPVIVGTLVEGMVMVVQAGRTQRGIVKRAMELLEQGHINLVGHILTGIEYFVPQYIYRYL
ncbi:MAG: CpsD/CapB family tyrosine-protein kinase [Candidatus Omnitrophica bacterium]|nr:CpsD/CapB family tyrosine-protein kinase [Candidatus Omnitrophota bacterium]